MKNWNLSLIVFSRDFFLENFPSLTSSYDVWVELSRKKKKKKLQQQQQKKYQFYRHSTIRLKIID